MTNKESVELKLKIGVIKELNRLKLITKNQMSDAIELLKNNNSSQSVK